MYRNYLFLFNIIYVIGVLSAALPVAAQSASIGSGQAYPSKTIRILVGFAPGGSTDIVARLIAQEMTKNVGQQVVVENRPGAGGNIAAELASKAAPDGYTLHACTTGVFAIAPFIYSKLPYDPEKGLVPVTQTGSLPYIIVMHPSLPAKNVKEFIAIAKSRPGQINYASSGVGTASHLSAALFATASGISMTHVPYKGTGNAMSDLIGGQVVLMFDQPVSSLPYIIVMHPSLPAKNVKEFIAIAKSRPGQINYASSGVGTASHLSAALFATASGISMTHVPYKGTGNAMSDLLAGQVVLMFDQPVSSLPHVQAGKLRVLGISSGTRFSTLKDIPTIAEQGLPGFEAISWAGICAPGGTPKPIVDRVYSEVAKVLKVPELRERLLRDGIEPIGSTPEQYAIHIKKEAVKWSKVVKDSGARVD